MSLMIAVEELLPELCRETNVADGKDYVVQLCVWSADKLEEYHKRSRRFNIVPDELMDSIGGYREYVLSGQAVFYEIVCIQDRDVVGLMYVDDLVNDLSTGRFSSARWHCELWDAKAYLRKQLLTDALKRLFETFGIHRMACEIPVKFGGAIRVAKNLGFKIEGRKREAAKFGGQWYDVLVMSLLRQEIL